MRDGDWESLDNVSTGPAAPKMMGGAYEAADQFDRALATWAPPIQAADANILPGKYLADARTDDMARNDAFVYAGVETHKDTVVGAHYRLNCKPRIKVLGLDPQWALEFAEETEAKFENWAESRDHWFDASRRNTLTSMTRLAVGVNVLCGEALATAEWARDQSQAYQTSLQMIAVDRLSTPYGMEYNNQRIRGGVEMNAAGAPIWYHIRSKSPGQFLDMRSDLEWRRVRARNRLGRPQIIHILDQQRPGQTRGISPLTAGLKEMRILKRFRDVTLQNAVVNASFAAAIESELPTGQVFESLGGGDVGTSVVKYAQTYLSAISEYAGSSRNMQVDGVKIPHLMPGTKLNMLPMGNPGGVGSEFEQGLLRYLSANLGISYEELTRDYTETNYSSARAAIQHTGRHMKSRKRMVADQFAGQSYRLWFEEAVNKGDIESMKARVVPNMYEGMNMDAFTNAEWIASGMGQIDELKETQAAVLRIKNRLSTYEIEIARMGHDYRPMFEQIAREEGLLDELEIRPIESNAMNAVTGDVREEDDE